jgi:hypothetical protein
LRAVQEQLPDDIETQEGRTVGLDIASRQRCQRANLTRKPLGDLLDLWIGGSEGSGTLEENGGRRLNEGTTRLPGEPRGKLLRALLERGSWHELASGWRS